MNESLTSGEQEVIDLYNQINQKISDTKVPSYQLHWLIQLGGDTPASRFIEENIEFLIAHWQKFVVLGIEQNDLLFLQVFISGLRKSASQDLRKEMAEFLTNEDRRIEYEFSKKIDKVLPVDDITRLTGEYHEKRNMIHHVAKDSPNTRLQYNHHAKPSTA